MGKSFSGDANSYRVYEFSDTSTRSIVKLVSRSMGDRMVRKGSAELMLEWDGKTPCYRLIPSAKAARKQMWRPRVEAVNPIDLVPSLESSTAFSQAELLAIAGTKFKHGRSRTARMTEHQKAERVKRFAADHGIRVAMEDQVERATDKKREWEQMGSLLQDVVVVGESVCL
jgi:hypothetical protein